VISGFAAGLTRATFGPALIYLFFGNSRWADLVDLLKRNLSQYRFFLKASHRERFRCSMPPPPAVPQLKKGLFVDLRIAFFLVSMSQRILPVDNFCILHLPWGPADLFSKCLHLRLFNPFLPASQFVFTFSRDSLATPHPPPPARKSLCPINTPCPIPKRSVKKSFAVAALVPPEFPSPFLTNRDQFLFDRMSP